MHVAGLLVERLVGEAQGPGAGREERRASGSIEVSRWTLMVAAVVSGSTAVRVVPLRSAATRIGTCSFESPRLLATPPRLRGLRSSFLAPLRLVST
jgi:hypothetical protein